MTNRRQIPPPAQRPQSSREARGRGPLKAKAVSAKTRTRCAKSPTEYENLEELAPEYGVSEAEPPPTFNFSEVEWTGIESAVATVRKRRITKEESESLCYYADEFIANSNARITKSYPSPGKRRESWRRAAKLCAEFRKAIEMAAKNRYGDAWKHETIGRVHYLGEVVDQLDMLECELNEHADPSYWEVSVEHSVTGRLDPSVVFYQSILWHWTDLGGSLTFTKDPSSGKSAVRL
jgi:hypothetical protein